MGLLAAVSYAVKQYLAPRVSQWYHEWRGDDDRAKAEDEQQKTAQLVANAIQSQVSLAHPQQVLAACWRACLKFPKSGAASSGTPREGYTKVT